MLLRSVSRSVEARLKATDASSPGGLRNALRLVAEGLALLSRLRDSQAAEGRESALKKMLGPATHEDASTALATHVGSLCAHACECMIAHCSTGKTKLLTESLPSALADAMHRGLDR